MNEQMVASEKIPNLYHGNIRKSQTYLLFAGHFFYPNGGARDFKKISDDLNEVLCEGERLIRAGLDWYQVVDHDTMNILFVYPNHNEHFGFEQNDHSFKVTH